MWYEPCDPLMWVRFDGVTVWRYGYVAFPTEPSDSTPKIATVPEYHPVYYGMKERLRQGFRLFPPQKSRVQLSGVPHPPNVAAQSVRRIYRQLLYWLVENNRSYAVKYERFV